MPYLSQMGWHYILTFTCKVLPEYIPFIQNKYLQNLYDTDRDFHYRYRPSYSYYEVEEAEKLREEDRLSRQKAEEEREKTYEQLPKNFRDLIDIWTHLDIGLHFYEYDIKGDEFTCKISKKVAWHKGDLKDDYLGFMKDIIVPISSEISFCEIESDDYGDMKWYYTDSQLRNVRFNLQDKIRGVHHIYSEDGSEIYETRVFYKHSIKKINFLDLDREYGIK